MLVLSRKRGQRVVIGDHVEMTIIEIRGDRVKLGFVGPSEIPIHREELLRRIEPWRNHEAEALLRGQAVDQAAFARAADLVLRDAKGFSHNAFKIDLARRAMVRALTQAANGTPQIQSSKKIR